MTQQPAGIVPEWTRGNRLRRAREFVGLGQKEFADRLGVSRNTVSSAENDTVEVRRITLNAWAMVTGVSAAWLETGAGSVTPGPDGGTREDVPSEKLARLTATKRDRTRARGVIEKYPTAA
ncbi:MAG TPA: helix-turn-helix transcriptional regulator [Acidimicrobiales bacterium]|nr:helix-turn-helix transcriptional regulator [Acidimicrobiales bacterium]